METIVTIKGEPVIDIYESFDGSYWFITEKLHRQDSVINGKVYKMDQILFGYVRLSACPECAEFGNISETELKLLGWRAWKVPQENWHFCPEVEVETIDSNAVISDRGTIPGPSGPITGLYLNYYKEVNKMAWRPTQYLIEGQLDNTVAGKVTGWMRFAGIKGKVRLDLSGNFHRDIRGTKIYFKGEGLSNESGTKQYMKSFSRIQTGNVGDMTAGYEPADYVKGYCYLEWYGDDNGRVVLELGQNQVRVIGNPLPADLCEPVSRKEQDMNMTKFLEQTAKEYSEILSQTGADSNSPCFTFKK